MKYFAYGSSLCLPRLRARAPHAEFVCVGKVKGFELKFNAQSHKDGSGKATLVAVPEIRKEVWGAVFEIDSTEKQTLDKEIGLGENFVELPVKIFTQQNEWLFALTYIANLESLSPGLLPYGWYMDLVIQGARQQGLPKDYIAKLLNTSSRPDPDDFRDALHRRFLVEVDDVEVVKRSA